MIFLNTEAPSRFGRGLSTLLVLTAFTIWFVSVLHYATLIGSCGCDICDLFGMPVAGQ